MKQWVTEPATRLKQFNTTWEHEHKISCSECSQSNMKMALIVKWLMATATQIGKKSQWWLISWIRKHRNEFCGCLLHMMDSLLLPGRVGAPVQWEWHQIKTQSKSIHPNTEGCMADEVEANQTTVETTLQTAVSIWRQIFSFLKQTKYWPGSCIAYDKFWLISCVHCSFSVLSFFCDAYYYKCLVG